MNLKHYFTFALLAIFALSACSKSEIDPSDSFGYEYFPIDSGRITIYKVDTTFYDLFNNTVFTRSWEVKEQIILTDKDPEDNDRVRVARSIRTWGTDNDFSIPVINYATRSTTTLDYQDNNLRFIKLAFPVVNEQTWFGNVYVDETIEENQEFYADWNYTYQNVDEPFSVGSLSFDETVLVSQVADNPENLLTYRFAEERYAKNVGLIYRKLDNLELKTGDLAAYVGISWPERANDGYSTTWEIIGYE